MKKGNVLAVLLATVGIMLFGTLAVSADAHAGIQSAAGKSSVPTAIAENESGAVTSAKASVGKTRKAKASVNAVADSGLYQVRYMSKRRKPGNGSDQSVPGRERKKQNCME